MRRSGARATPLLQLSPPIKAGSERLSHSNRSIPLNADAHVLLHIQ
jgi:hypothetical protein